MRAGEENGRGAALGEATRKAAPPVHEKVLPGAGLAVRIIAGVAFVNGMFEMLSVLLVRIPKGWNVTEVLPYGVHYWNHSLNLIFGFGLVYLSFNLLRRKRIAWWLALAGSALTVAASVLQNLLLSKGVLPVENLISSSVLITLLLTFRALYTVRSEPRSVRRGAVVVILSIASALAYGTLGFWLADPKDFGWNFSAAEALGQTVREYTFTTPATSGRTPQGDWFLDSLNVAGLFAAAFAAYSLFRPLTYRLSTLPRERNEARKVLESHGTSSLDFFKLHPEKSYFFSESGRSFVAYRTAANVAIALGDPSGPKEELEDLAARFSRYCRDNGWSVAFYQTPPDLLPMYRRLGMRSLKVGEEAVIDLRYFASKTAKKKEMRYTRRRYGEREGYTARWHEPPHPLRLLEEVKEVSDGWLTLPGRRERGFNLGRFGYDYVGGGRLFVVRDAEGRARAFANEIPSYRKGEATIDLMRHLPDVPNGVMDFLLVELMLSLAAEGYASFDLGLAPLAGVGEHPESPLEERALDFLSERTGRFFSYKGLAGYKAKFDPVWEDRYLVYRGGPQVLLAASVALTRLTENRAARKSK